MKGKLLILMLIIASSCTTSYKLEPSWTEKDQEVFQNHIDMIDALYHSPRNPVIENKIIIFEVQ